MHDIACLSQNLVLYTGKYSSFSFYLRVHFALLEYSNPLTHKHFWLPYIQFPFRVHVAGIPSLATAYFLHPIATVIFSVDDNVLFKYALAFVLTGQ